MNIDQLKWKKFNVLNDGFICLVDHMGDDSSIVQAARVSYGNDKRDSTNDDLVSRVVPDLEDAQKAEKFKKDRQLIRYLLSHGHTTPFEMVEIKFLVRVPMDCWRQWVRHRTASINEYSTRYTEAIDSQQTTSPGEWRLQATDNKQGSSGYLEEEMEQGIDGQVLTSHEACFHQGAKNIYQERIKAGVAKEQARKDLPLSTYTEAYWKCDLHNIFNFLRLRMDSHAQLEIRSYANAMYEIVKQICPIACEAFEDYVLNAKKFSAMEMKIIKAYMVKERGFMGNDKPSSMTDREWKEFLGKLS